MSEIIDTIWVCQDCMLVEANGECDPYRPEDLPEPLSLIVAPYTVTMGLMYSEHSEHCTPEDRAEDRCDCDHDTLSTSRCGGCGDTHHGDRYALTLWKD